jgi:hypothetical protein
MKWKEKKIKRKRVKAYKTTPEAKKGWFLLIHLKWWKELKCEWKFNEFKRMAVDGQLWIGVGKRKRWIDKIKFTFSYAALALINLFAMLSSLCLKDDNS